MRTIEIFYDNTGYTLRWLRALILTKKEFKERGFRIVFNTVSSPFPLFYKIFPQPDTKEAFIKLFKKKKYDIVFLAYHHSQETGICHFSEKDRSETLKYIKSKTNILCWLDTSDSTGTCMFDVLPYVDFYFKKQILKDIKMYTKCFYGGRIWCDYYHKNYHLDDNFLEGLTYKTLDLQYKDKIKLSWNVGLGDLFTKTKLQKILFRRRYAPFKFHDPLLPRVFDVHYRGSTSNSLVLFQRNKVVESLKNMNDISMPNISTKVKYKKYVEEVRNSKIVVSPFGWGEICGRDFEAFMHGGLLLKMDMSHMITYPDIYQPNITYYPIDWDFSNFKKAISFLLSNEGEKMRIQIALNGQKVYKEYLTSKDKKREFVDHILSQIIDNSGY